MVVRQTAFDWLGVNGYRMFIRRLPSTTFTVQKITIPDVALNAIDEATMFLPIPKFGTQLVYSELRLSFLVDEQLSNYLEIYAWMKGLGTPDSFYEFSTVAQEPGTGITSDVILYILDAKKNPKFQCIFYNAVPTGLGGLTFDATVSTMNFFQANLTLAYRSFDLEPIA